MLELEQLPSLFEAPQMDLTFAVRLLLLENQSRGLSVISVKVRDSLRDRFNESKFLAHHHYS